MELRRGCQPTIVGRLADHQDPSDCCNLAAKKLGSNVSTVSRRFAEVEKTLGVALFNHRKAGYLLTVESSELRVLAERVELTYSLN